MDFLNSTTLGAGVALAATAAMVRVVLAARPQAAAVCRPFAQALLDSLSLYGVGALGVHWAVLVLAGQGSVRAYGATLVLGSAAFASGRTRPVVSHLPGVMRRL